MKTMTPEEQLLYTIKGVIASLPEEDNKKVHEVAAQLRQIIKDNGDAGLTALALIGAEMQLTA